MHHDFQNIMTFNKCSIDGKAYGDMTVEVQKYFTNTKNECIFKKEYPDFISYSFSLYLKSLSFRINRKLTSLAIHTTQKTSSSMISLYWITYKKVTQTPKNFFGYLHFVIPLCLK